ncbi:hypothetical protein D3C78_965780 [compost metagenome]
MFGEVIRLVEINGMEHRVIYQKGPLIDIAKISEMYASESAEQRIEWLQQELDDELERLYEAIQKSDQVIVESCKEKLKSIRRELIQLEW